MNVYDWDNTIYKGDSTFDFVMYLYKNKPETLRNAPRTLFCGLLYGAHVMTKLKFKQNLYKMLSYIEDIDPLIDEFVGSHIHKVKDWYKQQQKEDDLVISASPEFLVKPFCEKINIHNCMASRVDKHTGKYDGENCHGTEKVRRYHEVYPNIPIDKFYSDSMSDDPMARISNEAYLVKGEKIEKWPE